MHVCALSRMLPVELFFIQYYSEIYSAAIDVAPPKFKLSEVQQLMSRGI
jgi:hypothetical protein